MRLFCGIPEKAWVPGVVMRPMKTIRKSAKARKALLTIVSRRNSPTRVKRFYERGVLKKNERMEAVWRAGRATLSLCGRLTFRSSGRHL